MSDISISKPFIHTADWQLGKPYARVQDEGKRERLKSERLRAVGRIGEAVRQHDAAFVVVAGDLFDTNTPTRSLISEACRAIGDLRVPVFAIPGNHDHAGPGSIWAQEIFRNEQVDLAPNFRLLEKQEPIEAPGAWIFPCPLMRRQTSGDPAQWLRTFDEDAFLERNPGAGDKPWIVLAHGSIQNFAADIDDEEGASSSPNVIEVDGIPRCFDYIALGDWHGVKRVNDRTWYSGSHEFDRFPKNQDYVSGKSLLVRCQRKGRPDVQFVETGKLKWHDISFRFAQDQSLDRFEREIHNYTAGRVGDDLLRLELSGDLGIEASAKLSEFIETLDGRMLRVKLTGATSISPTPEELQSLANSLDPMVGAVARRLGEMAGSGATDSATANMALRHLFQLCRKFSQGE